MQARASSRLLILDRDDRLLLFRFDFAGGQFAQRSFWCTPGGGVDPGESFAAAACRELYEETGLRLDDPGPEVARRRYRYKLVNGESRASDDHYFLIRVDTLAISDINWPMPNAGRSSSIAGGAGTRWRRAPNISGRATWQRL